MHSVRLISRGILLYSLLLTMLIITTSCGKKNTKTGQDMEVKVEFDSTYHAMNPMDLNFDSAEQAMIDSGMADLMDAYREIRAYGLPNSTPPALQFNPLPYGFQIPGPTEKIEWDIPVGISKPDLVPPWP
jgi:hypothetical protein